MGYNLLPTKEQITLVESLGADAWGVRQAGAGRKPLNCLIKYSETTTPISDMAGRQIVPAYEISFNGAVGLSVGDKVEIDGEVFTILQKREYKDFSRAVIYTKIKV